MSTIYLIRHGQASFGAANYDQLSDVGREQARLLGAHFAASDVQVDRIYSGSLLRQRETAALVAQALEPPQPPVQVDPAFNEYDSDAIVRCYAASLDRAQLDEAGWPDLKSDRRRFQRFLERAARAWVQAEIAADDMTPWRRFHGGVIEAFRELMRREGRSRTLAISTSGGVIGAIVADVLGLTHHGAIELNWAVHNASITRIFYNEEKTTLSMFNALPHLETRRELVTYR